jgi:hypothetical protein
MPRAYFSRERTRGSAWRIDSGKPRTRTALPCRGTVHGHANERDRESVSHTRDTPGAFQYARLFDGFSGVVSSQRVCCTRHTMAGEVGLSSSQMSAGRRDAFAAGVHSMIRLWRRQLDTEHSGMCPLDCRRVLLCQYCPGGAV